MNSEKRHYQKPYIYVIKLQPTKLICQTGGGEGPSGAREYRGGVWDEDE